MSSVRSFVWQNSRSGVDRTRQRCLNELVYQSLAQLFLRLLFTSNRSAQFLQALLSARFRMRRTVVNVRGRSAVDQEAEQLRPAVEDWADLDRCGFNNGAHRILFSVHQVQRDAASCGLAAISMSRARPCGSVRNGVCPVSMVISLLTGVAATMIACSDGLTTWSFAVWI